MPLHTLLVHLDTGPTCAERVDISTRLAREHGSHLIGLAPTGRMLVPLDASATLVEPGFLDLSIHQLRERAGEACAAFEARAAAAGLSSFETRIDVADHAASVLANAPGADLLLIGQTDRDAPPGLVGGDLPELTALNAGRPVLVVPFAGRFATLGERVLAAWNGRREATRAIADALPLLQRAQQVTVLTQRAPDVPEAALGHLEPWLLRHGVKAGFVHEVSELDVGNLLLSRACDLDADLIVMGCYGHSRLHERMLGGATRAMLDQMTVPVVMAH